MVEGEGGCLTNYEDIIIYESFNTPIKAVTELVIIQKTWISLE